MDEMFSDVEILAPFLPRSHVLELCSGRKAFAAWRDAKMNLYRRRMAHAYRSQHAIGLANSQREMRFVDGPGWHRLSIDPVLHKAAELRYGEGCWEDPDFRHRVERDHPEMRVPCPSRRLHPVNGFKDEKQVTGPPKPNQTLYQLHLEGRL